MSRGISRPGRKVAGRNTSISSANLARWWLQGGVSALALAVIMASGGSTPAHAGCPTISGTVTETQYLQDNENCTVSASGLLSTSGIAEYGIAGAIGNLITNEGEIRTSGDSSAGISAWDNGTIHSSGRIVTSGMYADALIVMNGNAITSTGIIITRGDYSNGISGYDENTVTHAGSMLTSGIGAIGIQLFSNNTIINSGHVKTTGDAAVAISLSDGNQLTNDGTIRTLGEAAHGISMQGGNIIGIGSGGIIETDGDFADGIVGYDNNQVTNEGYISTRGELSHGINLWNDNTVTNRGTITTRGPQSSAIAVFDNNTIVNDGNLRTEGAIAPAVSAGAGNDISNNGEITATGADSPAVEITGEGTTITNNGTIFSAQSWAIRADAGNLAIINAGYISGHAATATGGTDGTIAFSGTGNTLTLLPGSRITGLVDLGEATTVNILTGQPVVLHVDDVDSGTFIAPGQQVIIDPNNNVVIVQGAADYQEETQAGALTFGLLADGISGVLFGGMDSMNVAITAAADSEKTRQATPNAPQASVLAGSFLGRGKTRRTADWNTAYGGLMALRFHPAPGFLVGLHGGGGHTKTEGQKGKDAWFLGMHARYEANGAWLAGIVTTGQGGSSGGTVTYLDNLSPTGLRSFSTARKASFTSLEGRVGATFAVPGAPAGLTLSPELMARITRVKLKRLALDVPLLVDEDRRFTAFDGRAQLTAAFTLPSTEREEMRLLVTAGVARHAERGDTHDRTTGFAGARLRVHTADGVRFLIGGEGHVGKGGFVGYAATLSAEVLF